MKKQSIIITVEDGQQQQVLHTLSRIRGIASVNGNDPAIYDIISPRQIEQ